MMGQKETSFAKRLDRVVGRESFEREKKRGSICA